MKKRISFFVSLIFLFFMAFLLITREQTWPYAYRFARRVYRQLRPTPAPPAALHEATVLPRERRPNIILVVTDDLDATMGTLDTMSALQQEIIAKGIQFEQFFVNVSVCCPSRATIFRGQYAHNHHIYTPMPPLGGHPAVRRQTIEESTLPIWLQDAGYYTLFFGKYYNYFPPGENRLYTPPGWNEWYAPSKGKPFEGFNFTLNLNGKEVEFWGEEYYLTDVLATYILKALEQAAQKEQPFFLYIATYAPHVPANPAPRHAQLFSEARVPRIPSFNEKDIADKPPNIRSLPPLSSSQIEALDALYRRRLQTMQTVDELISQIVAFLETNGLWENTYFFFTSDNGFHLGQHRLPDGKGGPYEEDMRVPFIVRGPGIPQGKQTNILAGNVDIAPTIADLAGVKPPDWVDGRSLKPWLFEEKPMPQKWRQAYLFEFYGYRREMPQDGTYPSPLFLGLRTPSYVYIEYEDGFQELYDLEHDPYQLDNLAPKSSSDFLSYLSQWVQALAQCQADTCRMLEEQKPPRIQIVDSP